jgi:hypothetical protein
MCDKWREYRPLVFTERGQYKTTIKNSENFCGNSIVIKTLYNRDQTDQKPELRKYSET